MIGFPTALLPRLHCSLDGGPLRLAPAADLVAEGTQVLNGSMECSTCSARSSITNGILDLLGGTGQDMESGRELRLRDEEYKRYRSRADNASWLDHDRMEIQPSLEALGPPGGQPILELGCGDGRYTVELARNNEVLAVDFSIVALRHLRDRLEPASRVGLVLADVNHLKLEPRSFASAISTLISNLPTAAHRETVYRCAQHAVGPNGRFVFSVHHHGVRQRLAGEPKEGRYTADGIYRYLMAREECEREVRAHFRRVHVRPVQIFLPLGRTLGLPVLAVSRMLERVPLVNRLGNLLLCVARDPR